MTCATGACSKPHSIFLCVRRRFATERVAPLVSDMDRKAKLKPELVQDFFAQGQKTDPPPHTPPQTFYNAADAIIPFITSKPPTLALSFAHTALPCTRPAGFVGIEIPEQYGGAGLTFTSACIDGLMCCAGVFVQQAWGL
jgi:hypothetical protein